MRSFIATWPGRIAIVVLLAAVGGGAMVAQSRSAAPKAELRTASVTRGNVTQTVTVSGSVNASGQARLAFKTGGRLAQVYVTTGQTVTPGQPLAKLDTTDLETALATAQQNLANAQASYQKQLLAASDTRRALEDAERSMANDIAAAQSTLNKIRSNYGAAKTNFTSLTDASLADLAAYRSAIDTLRMQIQQVLTDLSIYGTSDVNSARNALNTADGALANAQLYARSLLTDAMFDHRAWRNALQAAIAKFDAAVAAGADTSTALAAYQTAQLDFNVAIAKLQNAIDTVSAQVSGAQTSVSSAIASLNTAASRPVTAFDPARSELASAQENFTMQSAVVATARTKLAQAGTPLGTITDAVNGSLVNAITTVAATQDRAATSLRNAQSAVANIPFNLQSAQVSIDNASNAVMTATANLDNAVLTAPAAGIVASIANQVGEFVTGGNTNSAFMVLTNTATMMLHGTIGESDVAKLKLGQVANITVDALSGARMTGRIASLDPVATISQGVPVYGIDIAIDVPAAGLRAGMSATGSVILASKQNVLIVPNTVIRTVAGQRGVQVLRDGEVVDTAVQLGLANDTVTEVTSGLEEGDTVVIPSARPTTSANPRIGGQGFGGPGIVPGGGIGR